MRLLLTILLLISLNWSKPIRLEEAFDLLAKNHPNAELARQESQLVSITASQVQKIWEPTLTSNLQTGLSSTNPFQKQQASWGAGLTLSESLRKGTSARISSAKGKIEIAQLEEKQILEDLYLEYAIAYVEAQYAYLRSLSLDSIVALFASQVEKNKQMVKAGNSSQLALKQIEAEYHSLVAESNMTKNAVIQKKRAMANLLSIDSVDISPWPTNWIDRIHQFQNPTVTLTNTEASLLQSIRIQEWNMESSQGALWPTLQLSASLTHEDPLLPNSQSTQVAKIQASLQFSLLDQGSTQLQIQESKIQKKKAELQWYQWKKDHELQQKNAWDDCQSLHSSLNAMQMSLEAETYAMQELKIQWELGLVDVSTFREQISVWLKRKNTLYDAEEKYILSFVNYISQYDSIQNLSKWMENND